MKSDSSRYKEAGVDVNAGYRAVELMKASVARTRIPGVVSGLGGFGGMFMPDFSGMKKPILVSGTDGVGTKLKLAFLMDRHDTVGIDCVAMCVNDIICCGAKPLFFLDYLALGKNVPEKVASIVSGVAEGCVQAGCALIGGETAEMPGFYPEDEYDMAGFAVGMVDEADMLNPDNARAGDVIIGLPSSGLHSNGYSLARKLFDVERADLLKPQDELQGQGIGQALLTPTRIYVKPVLEALKQPGIRSIAHITGGGFYENIPRALPKGLYAAIERAQVPVLPVFHMLMRLGDMPEKEMFSTFNMGIGMVLVVDRLAADAVMAALSQAGENPLMLGEVKAGDEELQLC